MRLLGKPLGYLMYLIYNLTGNYGLTLILFTLLIKLIQFPLQYSNSRSASKNRALAPKLEGLRKKYANNPTKCQEESMRLKAKYKIGSANGCISSIISMFILYGMLDVVYKPLTHLLQFSQEDISYAYSLLKNYTDLTGIQDKGISSSIELGIIKYAQLNPVIFKGFNRLEDILNFDNTLCGIVDLSLLPNLNPDVWNLSTILVLIIPSISAIFQIISVIITHIHNKKVNPDSKLEKGSIGLANFILPLFSIWMGYTFPIALSIYWGTSAILGFLITILLWIIFPKSKDKLVLEKDYSENNSTDTLSIRIFNKISSSLQEKQSDLTGQEEHLKSLKLKIEYAKQKLNEKYPN